MSEKVWLIIVTIIALGLLMTTMWLHVKVIQIKRKIGESEDNE